MKLKKAVFEEITWEQAKVLATSQDAAECLPLHSEIAMELEGGEAVTVVVAAHLPATKDSPAGIRFVFKDCLYEPRQMNKESTNKGGYQASDGRRHVLEDIYPRLPAKLRAVIRPRKITEIVDGETLTYEDPLWLLSESDVFGRGGESWQNGVADGPDDFQLPVFQSYRDRVKICEDEGSCAWWMRSVAVCNSDRFCLVAPDGSADNGTASWFYGVAPGFDI